MNRVNDYCFNCKKTSEDLGFKKMPFACGQCRRAHYCGKNCQINHWKEHHKQVCKLYVNNQNIMNQVKPERQEIIKDTRKFIKNNFGSLNNLILARLNVYINDDFIDKCVLIHCNIVDDSFFIQKVDVIKKSEAFGNLHPDQKIPDNFWSGYYHLNPSSNQCHLRLAIGIMKCMDLKIHRLFGAGFDIKEIQENKKSLEYELPSTVDECQQCARKLQLAINNRSKN